MGSESNNYWRQQLQEKFSASIPMCEAMGLKVSAYDGEKLLLTAPLAPNINDKGTAFGGSISSLLTLAGWGLLWIACARAGIKCDIFIHKGVVTYNKPLRTDLQAVCKSPGGQTLAAFLDQLERKGRARMPLVSELISEGDIMARFECQFAALAGGEAK